MWLQVLLLRTSRGQVTNNNNDNNNAGESYNLLDNVYFQVQLESFHTYLLIKFYDVGAIINSILQKALYAMLRLFRSYWIV